MHKLISAVPLNDYKVRLRFDDGTTGEVNLADIVAQGVFRRLLDANEFTKLRVGPHGELSWSEDLDLCPDALYLRLTGKSVNEIFPGMAGATVNA